MGLRKKRRSRTFRENNRVINFDEVREKRKEKRKQVIEKKKKPDTGSQVSERRAVKMHRRRLFCGAVFLVVVAVIGYSVYNIVSLRGQRAQAETAKEGLLKEKARLEKELQQVDSDEYIENEARGSLHMIKPGETIYILPEQEKTTAGAFGGDSGGGDFDSGAGGGGSGGESGGKNGDGAEGENGKDGDGPKEENGSKEPTAAKEEALSGGGVTGGITGGGITGGRDSQEKEKPSQTFKWPFKWPFRK